MNTNCETFGVRIREAPIETPGSIVTVGIYHAPLRDAYERIRSYLYYQTSDAEFLTMEVYMVIFTVGPEVLCPNFLVLGAIPTPVRAKPSPMLIELSEAIEKGMEESPKEQSTRLIYFGVKHTKGPKPVEASMELHKLPSGSPVLVYRCNTKTWEVPALLVSVDD